MADLFGFVVFVTVVGTFCYFKVPAFKDFVDNVIAKVKK